MAEKDKNPSTPISSTGNPEPESHRRKKQKTTQTRSEFPRFDDGDTVISLTQDESQDLILHRVELRRMSGYFASFSDIEWPERFELVHGEESSQLKPATENNRTSNGPCISIAGAVLCSRIHEILFRILYHQPVSFSDLDLPAEQLLLKLMDLTRVYDCLNYVKDQLTAEIYTGDCFGREKIAKRPDVFLNIANRLRNERLFQEALQHAVGQTLQHNKDLDSLDKDLEEIVNECADGLFSRVQKTCVSLYMLTTAASLPDFVACSIFHRFLQTHLATKRVASGEMFATFQYLHKLVSGTELLETMKLGWLVESAAEIQSGAREAINFIGDQDDDSDRDWLQHRQSTLDGLYNVQRLELTPDRIKAALKNLVTGAQTEIRPLMEVGADYGYFTCIDFKCLYPWEENVSESPEAE